MRGGSLKKIAKKIMPNVPTKRKVYTKASIIVLLSAIVLGTSSQNNRSHFCLSPWNWDWSKTPRTKDFCCRALKTQSLNPESGIQEVVLVFRAGCFGD